MNEHWRHGAAPGPVLLKCPLDMSQRPERVRPTILAPVVAYRFVVIVMPCSVLTDELAHRDWHVFHEYGVATRGVAY